MNEGVKNEYNFAKELNNQYFKNIKSQYRELLKVLFPTIRDEHIIECWVSRYNEKSDIKIRVNGIIKGISIKMGHHNSVHLEHIDDFTKFLTRIGVDEPIINKIKDFFEWKRANTDIKSYYYKKTNIEDLNLINKELNNYYIKINLIMRFLFQGNDRFNYSAHAIIYGTPDNFLWATRDEILKLLIESENNSLATIKIGLLTLQTLIKKDIKSNNYKQFIQIKWHTLESSMVKIYNERKKLRM